MPWVIPLWDSHWLILNKCISKAVHGSHIVNGRMVRFFSKAQWQTVWIVLSTTYNYLKNGLTLTSCLLKNNWTKINVTDIVWKFIDLKCVNSIIMKGRLSRNVLVHILPLHWKIYPSHPLHLVTMLNKVTWKLFLIWP